MREHSYREILELSEPPLFTVYEAKRVTSKKHPRDWEPVDEVCSRPHSGVCGPSVGAHNPTWQHMKDTNYDL